MSSADPLLITDTDISGVLKNVYAKYRINCFPLLTALLANVKKATPGGPERMSWGGNGVYWDVKLTRPGNAVSSDAGMLGTHAKAVEKQASLGIKRNYVTKHIDALADFGTRSRDAAFVSLTDSILQEAMDAGKLFQQEQLHGDGKGIKAVVKTVTDTTHIVVNSPYGVASSGQGSMHVDQDMYIAVLDTTGGTLRGAAFVSSIAQSSTSDDCTVTLASAISGMQATDIVVAASTSTANGYNQNTNGLLNITNRGNNYASFEGITSASYARWTAKNLVAGTDTPTTTPDEMDIYDLVKRVRGFSGKDAMQSPGEFLAITTVGVTKSLGQNQLGQRRFDMGQQEIKGGFKAVNICGLSVIEDINCPAGTFYLLHLPSLTWIDGMDWKPLNFKDSGTWRFIAGRDAYETSVASYWNFGALQRNSHGVITGYADAVRYGVA